MIKFWLALALAGAAATTSSPAAAPTTDETQAPVVVGAQTVTLDIDNGSMTSPAHSQAVYRITVRNPTAVDYPDALIAQMLPAALSFSAAQPRPEKYTQEKLSKVNSSEVVWVRHLPAHGEVTIELTAAIGAKPANGQVSTTACVMPDGETRPLICDTDADAVDPRTFSWLWILLAVGGLPVVGIAGLWLRRRRRLARAQPS